MHKLYRVELEPYNRPRAALIYCDDCGYEAEAKLDFDILGAQGIIVMYEYGETETEALKLVLNKLEFLKVDIKSVHLADKAERLDAAIVGHRWRMERRPL